MRAHDDWFPVRAARDGWGWGLPTAWQGWVVYAVYVAALGIGIPLLAPHGLPAMLAYVAVSAALFLGVVIWKGEPQRMRDNGSP